jgi:hypothetical protein
MRQRAAAEYALHLGILLAASAFRCSSHLRHVWVAAIHDNGRHRTCYLSVDFDRWRFARLDLKNLGEMEADEVAQLYVKRIDSKVERPEKELEAFERVTLKAGETQKVTLEFPVSELAHWDNETNGWVLETGKIEILVGSASDDIRQSINTEI